MNRLNYYMVLSIIAVMIFFLASPIVVAQDSIDNSMENCSKLMDSGYISNGQELMAMVDENNTAKFTATFYGGSYYRIIACTNINDFPLRIKVMDSEKNVLFDNIQYNYAPFWNLAFTSTVQCFILIEVEAEEPLNKLVKLLIGYKDESIELDVNGK